MKAAGTTLGPRQLAAFRTQLEQQKSFRLEQLEQLRAIDPENASEVTEVLAAGARVALDDVLAALHRMNTGRYGRCTECAEPIPLERLEVLPQVGRCLVCSRNAAARAGG